MSLNSVGLIAVVVVATDIGVVASMSTMSLRSSLQSVARLIVLLSGLLMCIVATVELLLSHVE